MSGAILTQGTALLEYARTFRQRAMANGYRLIRVRSNDKAPLAPGWQFGEDRDALLDVKPGSQNTGLLLGGLRCIDVDVDDPLLVSTILEKAIEYLPAGALKRQRTNSPRVALLFRASEGQPSKCSIDGTNGKIEILGAGQQVVVHGVHPDGAEYFWTNGLGPDVVERTDLPAISEQQIQDFLSACAPLIGADKVCLPNTSSVVLEVTDPRLVLPTASNFGALDAANDLGAGIEDPNWFERLTANNKKALVEACLQVLDNRVKDPRPTWLRVLFALGDAERLGCPDARELALEWSRQGKSWTSEEDFEVAWTSYKDKPGGVTVGTLLSMAHEAGLDLSLWRGAVLTDSGAGNSKAADLVSPTSSRSPRALKVSALPINPPKREWLHGIDLIRGAVSLLVAPGGRGKSSWLVTLSLACASGRSLLGAHVFGGPLRVLLISAEDPQAEVALRIRAAMKHHGLVDGDVSELHVIGADRWGLQLMSAAQGGPVLNEPGWEALISELDEVEPDVVVIDPLISLMGGASQNDNAAAALFMSKLVKLAATRRIAIMVAHHASKGRDPLSAESAMGAASFVNLSRIALAIEPLAEKDAGAVNLPPWEARSVFRVVGTKHNLSPASETDRWFRHASIEMGNAAPPTYPHGDNVGVVEVFQPGACGAMFPSGMVGDALSAIAGASTPLSPSKRANDRHVGPELQKVIAQHRGGRSTETEAQLMLKYLKLRGFVRVDDIKVPRPGKGYNTRKGLVLTTAGEHALQNNAPQPPQHPSTCVQINAGGAPMGPPPRPGGCGGNEGVSDVGARSMNSSSTASTELPPQAENSETALGTAASEARTRAPEPIDTCPEKPSEPNAHPSITESCGSASTVTIDVPAPPSDDDLVIPPFLDRRKKKPPQ